MKRYNRMSQNAICVIPRKAIAWTMLSMAVMTILSFVLIELRRIITLRNMPKNGNLNLGSHLFFPLDTSPVSPNFTGALEAPAVLERIEKGMQTKGTYSDELIETLFEEYPNCLEKPYLLIIVTSAPENFERRDAIRRAWANVELWKLQVYGLKAKTIFLVGQASSKFINVLLRNENRQSGDVLLGNYMDTYRNLTWKVLHGFSWAASYCQPSFILKTDDDCFVNVPLLLQFLWKFNPVRTNLYAGRVRWSAEVIRDPNSRWFVSAREYPRPRYAPYISGAGYVLSFDVLEKLVAVSNRITLFPNEDAYVGTVLNIARVRPTYSARFVTQNGPWQVCNFLYLFVVHRVRASKQNEFQSLSNRAMELCSMDQLVKDWV